MHSFIRLNRPWSRGVKISLVVILMMLIASLGWFGWKWQRTAPHTQALPVPLPEYSSQTMTGQVTNQWYSSLYFSEWSEPLFAFPLSYKLSPASLEINYPNVVGTPKTVFASHRAQLELLPSAGTWQRKEVLSADSTSVAFKLCTAQSCLQTRVGHGLPSLVMTADRPITLTLKGSILNTSPVDNGFYLTTDHGIYLVAPFTADDTFITTQNNQLTIALPKEGQLLIALQPDTQLLSPDQWRFEVTGVQAGYKLNSPHLSLGINYQSNQTPLLAALPHFTSQPKVASLGSYSTLRGTLQLYPSHQLLQTLPVPQLPQVSELVSALTTQEQDVLKQKVRTDAATLTQQTPGEGVYFGGKDIFKRAQLYEIAKALGETQSALALENQLVTTLTQRLSLVDQNNPTGYLSRSEQPQGVLAAKPEFGHEFFNDHHFHFGYYVAASGILLKHRPDLAPLLKPGIDLLLADIANLDTSNGYPWLRGFDAYEGHSWADGRALAADGNNQESTSEAMNRWYGIWRLGQATQNTQLQDLGLVGMASEANAAQTFWLGQKPDRYRFAEGYQYPIASIVWGGKVDYATWFSAEPTHIFGIQFLPSTPALVYLQDPKTWAKYLPFYQQGEPEKSWNDIWSMVAVMNKTQVNQELPVYEGGNTASWYYLWVTYWTKSTQSS